VTVGHLLALARLMEASCRLDRSGPDTAGTDFEAYLDALSAVTGTPRAEIDAMTRAELRALMDRAVFGDAFADASEVARAAWEDSRPM
jgi:hypothetical protein